MPRLTRRHHPAEPRSEGKSTAGIGAVFWAYSRACVPPDKSPSSGVGPPAQSKAAASVGQQVPGRSSLLKPGGSYRLFFLNQKSGTFTHSFHGAHGENRSHSRPFDQRDLNQGFGCKVTEEAGHPRD